MWVRWTPRSSAAQPLCDFAARGFPNQWTATPESSEGGRLVTDFGGFAPHCLRLAILSAMTCLLRVRSSRQAIARGPYRGEAGQPGDRRRGTSLFYDARRPQATRNIKHRSAVAASQGHACGWKGTVVSS
jgi:hypothetical protein